MGDADSGQGGTPHPPRDFVYIVESPSPEDLLDGRTEGRLLMEGLHLSDIMSFYSMATNLDCFEDALRHRLDDAMININGIPIIHLSAHGNKRGIGLTNGDIVEWAHLRDLLLPINDVLDGGLLVCISACASYYGSKMALPNTRLPFWELVGHPGKPEISDAAVGFVAFYHRLFSGSSVPDAVKAMRAASGDEGFKAIRGNKAHQIWTECMEELRRRQGIASLVDALVEGRRRAGTARDDV